MTETREQKIQLLEQHLSDQPNSPRFAELASYYLEVGRSSDALTLCDQGLAHHPFYSTGHFIKGKTLLAMNMRAEARREFQLVQAAVPNSDAVANYLKQIPSTADETFVAEAPSVSSPAEKADQAFGIEEATPAAEAPIQETPAELPQEETQPAPVPSPEPTTEQSPEELLSKAAQEEQAVEPPLAQPSELPQTQEEGILESPVTSEPVIEESLVEPSAAEPSPESSPGEITEEPETFRPEEPPAAEEPVEASLQPQPEPSVEGESYEQYSERKKIELAGTENSISLDDYLYGSPEQLESPHETDQPAPEPPVTDAAETSEPEDPFAQLSQMAEESSPPDIVQPADSGESNEDPFAGLRQEEPESAPEDPQEEGPTQEKDQIEEITEKLQNAKKIAPVINLSERSPAPGDESESPSGSGFVTPTLAEIYAKQGWYNDAIKAYKALAASKPAERDKYEARIQELEEEKKRQEDSGG